MRPAAESQLIQIPVAPGELIDKITILQIKSERIADPDKLANVRHELAVLAGERDRHLGGEPELDRLGQALKAVNERLWELEDAIREHERQRRFDDAFVEVARSIYKCNDERAALKRAINLQQGSQIVEEKSYAAY